jgi:hypothetical protein
MNIKSRYDILLDKPGIKRYLKNWSTQGWSLPVDTADDLVDELERQMRGYKDRHDNLIDAYLAQWPQYLEEINLTANHRCDIFQ